MKLRTNYTKPLWIRFFGYVAAYFLIAGAFTYLDFEYFLKPSLDVLGIMTKQTDGDTSLLEKTLTSIKTEMVEKYGAEYTISSMLVFFFGLMFGALFLFVRIMMWGFMVAEYVIAKCKIMPSMRLVVIKNDKMWFKI